MESMDITTMGTVLAIVVITYLIALAEVGYLEKASNEQLDDKTANAGKKNFTKYARDMKAVTGVFQ